MSLVIPMFSASKLRVERLAVRVYCAWDRLEKARRRKERAGDKLDSHHYLTIVDCEHRLIKAVDEWQRARKAR